MLERLQEFGVDVQRPVDAILRGHIEEELAEFVCGCVGELIAARHLEVRPETPFLTRPDEQFVGSGSDRHR